MQKICLQLAYQTSETFLLSAILALSGGFQDAYTYNVRNGVFSNAQTGNVVLMSQHLMEGNWMRALHYLFPVLAFAFGVLVAERIGHTYKNARKIHWRQIVVLIEILILLAVGFMPQKFNMAATMLGDALLRNHIDLCSWCRCRRNLLDADRRACNLGILCPAACRMPAYD